MPSSCRLMAFCLFGLVSSSAFASPLPPFFGDNNEGNLIASTRDEIAGFFSNLNIKATSFLNDKLSAGKPIPISPRPSQSNNDFDRIGTRVSTSIDQAFSSALSSSGSTSESLSETILPPTPNSNFLDKSIFSRRRNPWFDGYSVPVGIELGIRIDGEYLLKDIKTFPFSNMGVLRTSPSTEPLSLNTFAEYVLMPVLQLDATRNEKYFIHPRVLDEWIRQLSGVLQKVRSLPSKYSNGLSLMFYYDGDAPQWKNPEDFVRTVPAHEDEGKLDSVVDLVADTVAKYLPLNKVKIPGLINDVGNKLPDRRGKLKQSILSQLRPAVKVVPWKPEDVEVESDVLDSPKKSSYSFNRSALAIEELIALMEQAFIEIYGIKL